MNKQLNYYIDTEFHEYAKQQRLLGMKVGKPVDTIELISIGIVCEDGRKYYAICNEFDLKAAWSDERLRENVLKQIHKELCEKVSVFGKTYYHYLFEDFTYKSMKNLLSWYGKSREQIKRDVHEFCVGNAFDIPRLVEEGSPRFYAYYADYDWVVFCWLFGRMIDLPKGFPMYCTDLKQMLDEKCEERKKEWLQNCPSDNDFDMLNHVKGLSEYPKQENEHNALADAAWNQQLHKFIKTL